MVVVGESGLILAHDQQSIGFSDPRCSVSGGWKLFDWHNWLFTNYVNVISEEPNWPWFGWDQQPGGHLRWRWSAEVQCSDQLFCWFATSTLINLTEYYELTCGFYKFEPRSWYNFVIWSVPAGRATLIHWWFTDVLELPRSSCWHKDSFLWECQQVLLCFVLVFSFSLS